MGPVISAEQQERVLGFLERAVEAKATVLTGGGAVGDRGFFVAPTIVADVAQDSRDRPERGLRPRRDRAAVRLGRRGGRDGERRPLRARRVRVLRERRPGDEGRRRGWTSARVWVNEHLFPLDAGDAARRLQGVRLRQGHVDVLDGGVHADQARLRQARLSRGSRATLSPCSASRAGTVDFDAMRRYLVGTSSHCAVDAGEARARPPAPPRRGPVSRRAELDAVDQWDHRGAPGNGRESFRRIAASLGVSEATVRARYAQALRPDILQVTGVTNPLGLGFEAQAMVGDPATGPPEAVADEIARWDEADYVVVTAGRFDILVEVVCADRRGLLDVTNRIRALAGRHLDRELPLPRALEAALRLGRARDDEARLVWRAVGREAPRVGRPSERRSAAMTAQGADVRLDRRRQGVSTSARRGRHLVEIPRGSFFALLGPSGCGKTTTLRMIGGFEEPTEGAIFLGDRDVVGLPPYKRDVNTVFQSYALFPHMTVFDNVAFGLQRKGLPKGEIRAARARDARARRPRRAGEPQAAAALGRPAAARRARAGDRQQPARAPPGRAARRPRPEAAQADAARAEAHPERGRHHVRARDARPGGGDDDGGHDRRDEPGAGSSSSARRRSSTRARGRRSSRASSASPTSSTGRSGRRRGPARRRHRRSAPTRTGAAGRSRSASAPRRSRSATGGVNALAGTVEETRLHRGRDARSSWRRRSES